LWRIAIKNVKISLHTINVDNIAQSPAEILLFPVSENKRPPHQEICMLPCLVVKLFCFSLLLLLFLSLPLWWIKMKILLFPVYENKRPPY